MTKRKPNSPAEVAELTHDLKRIQAEFVNFKRRSNEERGELVELVKQDVVLQILPLLDNLSRALTHLPEALKDDAWAKGVSQVGIQAEATLRDLGVTKIDPTGELFDPHLHEAIAFEDGVGEIEVVDEVIQPGYRLGDKVLRPAMVKVKRVNDHIKDTGGING